MKIRHSLQFLALVMLIADAGAATPCVSESSRSIPAAYQVDVLVIGGSTGAVAAATAAARDGSRVFLAAPLPYLGEDMTGTLRLWLEEGEIPTSSLARKIFGEKRETGSIADPSRLVPFTYGSDLPSSGPHRDTKKPSLLSDGRWGSATNQSVQYDGDVNITLNLQEATELESAHVMVYHTRDFQVDGVTLFKSDDGTAWTRVAEAANAAPSQPSVTEPALVLSIPVTGTARFLKVSIRKDRQSSRILVGELAVVKKGGPVKPRKKVIPPARPLHIKKVLDDELLAAGVDFLYSSYVTDVLRDERNNPCGVVMANRSGRQAIVAKTIIDATGRAWVARMAGAESRPFPAGVQTLKWVVVGGEPRRGKNLEARTISPPFQERGSTFQIIEYTLSISMADGSFPSWARAEQAARNATYHPDQQFTSDLFFQVPPDPLVGQVRTSGDWPGVEALDLRAFRPGGAPRCFVLGGCADLPRSHAEKLLRPLALMDLGTRIGLEASREARALPAPRGARVQGEKLAGENPGEVREILTGVRPYQKLPGIPQESRSLKVLGTYDVVVIGGGTSGAPAGIGAARQGARTLVVEYLHGLGGVGTQGAISKYYWGNRVGFSAEVGGGPGWAIEQKMQWWRENILKAGGEIWFGSMGCGAFVEDGRVRGAVVATPEGRGVVLADVVIDSTGNADMAAAAGSRVLYTDAADIAMQGTGLPPRRLGASYTNTDFTIVDETDALDVWQVLVYAKHKAGEAFDLGKLLDTRERRRVVGDFTISILDEVNQRTYPDTIVVAYSDFDTHGYTTHPYFTLQHPPSKKGFRTNIPYRALLPRGLEGILVTGLGISAHRDAIPLIRMQADCQNMGYAAGVVAAAAARKDARLRDVDLRSVQEHLVKIGNLPERVLTDQDSYPFPDERIRAAVEAAGDGYRDVAIILANPLKALPLLRDAYRKAESPERKLIYAHILATLGDATGVMDLIAAIQSSSLDRGWKYTGMGQFGPNMSPLDRLIYAVGCTRDRRGTAPIVEKLKLLEAKHEFSHFRAMALALEKIGDPAAAEALAEAVSRPGIRGHACPTIEGAIERARKFPSWNATEPRSNAIRELMLGRALYRCGDWKGLGRKILEEYTRDLRGHLSRHANAVLESPE